MSCDVVCEVPSGEGLYVVSRPQDGAPQGRVLEGRGMQMVKYNLLWHTLNLQSKANLIRCIQAPAGPGWRGAVYILSTMPTDDWVFL